jgi:hypothetical protein
VKHTTGLQRGKLSPGLSLLALYLAGSLLGYALGALSCAGAQRPTLAQAKAGLALACDALAFAVAEGKRIPGDELAARVCDVERTAAVMQRLADSREPPREIMTEPPDWLDAGAH